MTYSAAKQQALALQTIALTKRYPGTLAVDGVDLELRFGEVHALLGENGAGKSTLMKMLAGSFRDYEGRILINGEEVALHSPAIAKAKGIAMIHQEINLSMPQSIAENLLAGALPTRGGFIDRKSLKEKAIACLKRVSLELDVEAPVESLGQHEQQLVEIAKALATKPRILVMDEPTSALSREDVERLFTIIHTLKAEGMAIVYISHHLSEVFEVADRATVLRDGRKVGTRNMAETTYEELIEMMVGRAVAGTGPLRQREHGAVKVKAEGLTRRGFFQGVSFTLHEGEIVGLFGLMGSGTTEVARSLVGADPLHAGTTTLHGKTLPKESLPKAIEAGVAYLTEDRKEQGLALRLDIVDNILASIIPRLSKGSLFTKGRGADVVNRLTQELRVSPPNPTQIVGNLSGGNQQKVLLAKWMAADPEFMILDEPTRGVDIGAKETIHHAIGKMADAGKAILVISSDLPELMALCDRVLVMKDGRIRDEIPRAALTERNLLLAANGVEVAA